MGTGNGRFESGSITVGTGAGSPGATTTTGLTGNGNNFVEKTLNYILVPFLMTKTGQPDVSGRITGYSGSTFTLDVTPSLDYTNGTLNVAGVSATISTINVAAKQVTISGSVQIPFVLHDDDDDGRLPYATLSLAWFTTVMQDAYVAVLNDGGGNINNNKWTVPFVLNVTNLDQIAAVMNSAGAFESKNNRSDDFWITWLCSTYQPAAAPNADYMGAGDNRADGDPGQSGKEDPLIAITTLDVNGTLPPLGALIFLESFYDWGITYYATAASILEPQLVAHELGHTLGLDYHDRTDDTVMGHFWIPGVRFAPDNLVSIRIRVKSPGVP